MANYDTQVKADREVELYRELLATNSLSPFLRHNSSVRQQMFSAQHLTQTLVFDKPTERYIQTGMEAEYGKYTFSKKAPEDIEVIKVIQRYPKGYDYDSIAFNPETFVIYEEEKTKEVGILSLTSFCSNHQYFGFEYKNKPALDLLKQGAFIPKDTILQDSSNVLENGAYCFGKQLNTAFMTIPGVAEDGIVICEDVLKDFSFNIFERRVVEFGRHSFPRNLYGTEEVYKPFPDIGDTVREDGLLAALAPYEEYGAISQMNRRESMQADTIFDKLVYANGEGGMVVDIRVDHDPFSNKTRSPEGMDHMLEKYEKARRACYQEVVTIYHELRKRRGEGLRISKELQRFLVEAIAILDDNSKGKIEKLYRLNPIDDWRLEFTIKYHVKPDLANKLAAGQGF